MLSPIAGFRKNGARWISVIALTFLVFSVLLFIWMWARAYMQGNIPQESWAHGAKIIYSTFECHKKQFFSQRVKFTLRNYFA